MQITIFGAAGKIGQRTVNEALSRGYSVVAFVHNENPFLPTSRLTIVKGDIHEQLAVAKAIKNSDAVISGLGSWHTKQKDILTSAMESVIPAMEQANIRRIVTLTGAAAFDTTDTISFGQKLSRVFFSVVGGKILQDGEEHIRLLRASQLDWTVIRAPVMNNRGSDSYILRNKLPAFTTICRQAVAKSLIDQLEQTDFLQQSPVIYRTR